VEYFFNIISGWEWMEDAALIRAGIKRVQVRHEMTAAFAAEGWGRMTGRPGVALVGGATGPEFASAGVIQAKSAQAPMIFIGGESNMWDDNMQMGQGISRPHKEFEWITKYATRVGNPAVLLWETKRAFRAANTPPTGPVCLEIPGEIFNIAWHRGPRANYLLAFDPVTWTKASERPTTAANPQDLDRVMKWFFEAERPAIITGEQVAYDYAIPELQEFVQLTGIPTHCRRSSRGAISEYDPLNCYGRARGAVMRRSDRTMVIGLRVQYLELFGYPPFWNDKARHIQIQACPENVCMTLPTEFELHGNMKVILRQMIDWCKANGITKPPEKWNDWRADVAGRKEGYEKKAIERTKAMEGKVPLHPDLVGKLGSEFLHDELNDDYYFLIDGFTAASYFTDWNKMKFAPSILDASDTIGFGQSPGHALAIGLLSNRNKPILAIMGDGAVGAAGMEIETCSRWNIPCVFMHLNNNAVATGLQYAYPASYYPSQNPLRDHTSTLPNIRYDKMMAEFGCHTEFVQRDVELKPAMKRAFDFVRTQYRPAFVEVFIDPDVLQEIWTTFLIPMSIGHLPWDQLGENARAAISETYERTLAIALPWRHPSWAEGVKKYREEKGMK
jgi:acetolactate synthase-1/2/3 large subunit